MNSENSKTSDPHRLLLNLLDKQGWGSQGQKYLFYHSQGNSGRVVESQG